MIQVLDVIMYLPIACIVRLVPKSTDTNDIAIKLDHVIVCSPSSPMTKVGANYEKIRLIIHNCASNLCRESVETTVQCQNMVETTTFHIPNYCFDSYCQPKLGPEKVIDL